jgi:hypothetical protein
MTRRAFTQFPMSIAPGQAPGGVVFRVYSVHDGKLVVNRCLFDMASSDMASSDLAREDAAATAALGLGAEDVIPVGYDGDTGERIDL